VTASLEQVSEHSPQAAQTFTSTTGLRLLLFVGMKNAPFAVSFGLHNAKQALAL
jgi:hypothetical protein